MKEIKPVKKVKKVVRKAKVTGTISLETLDDLRERAAAWERAYREAARKNCEFASEIGKYLRGESEYQQFVRLLQKVLKELRAYNARNPVVAQGSQDFFEETS